MARRLIIAILIVPLFFALAGLSAIAKEDRLPPPTLGEDGLYKQPWFHDSFLDLREDVADAASQGKRLVLMWEQKGCPYCKRTHEVNFRIPKIVNLIKDKFVVVQLNLWGDREVTDFDGEKISEKKLAQKWAIRFTPTIQFFPADIKKIGKANGRDAELVRVPGYFKPFHFFMLFKYIDTKSYETETNFQRYLIAEGTALREKGVDMDKQLWADTLLFD